MRTLAAVAVAAALAAIAGTGPAKADLIFTGSQSGVIQGTGATALSASVDFSLTGSLFQITLTNLDKSIDPGSVLTNLEVTTAPAPGAPLPGPDGTIALGAGSVFLGASATAADLGANWAYVAGIDGGAASSGFSVGNTAGGHGNLCGVSGCGVMLDGASFGLVGQGTIPTVDPLKNNVPYVEDTVVIDITLAAGSLFTLADITNVVFEYGTGAGEPLVPGVPMPPCIPGTPGCTQNPPTDVPEPGSLLALGSALVAFGVLVAWRRRSPVAALAA